MADYHGAASEGTRAQNLMKKREKQKEEIEKLKQKIADVSLSEYGTHIGRTYEQCDSCMRVHY